MPRRTSHGRYDALLRRALARHGVADCDDCGTPTPLRAMRIVMRGRGRERRVERHCPGCVAWGPKIRAWFREHFGTGGEGR